MKIKLRVYENLWDNTDILASSEDQDSTTNVPTKKAKVDKNKNLNDAGGQAMTWEIEEAKSTWTTYSDEQVKLITEAFKSEKADVDITDGKVEFTILFERMVQRNKKSGWERRIRCMSTDGNSDTVECRFRCKLK